MPIAHVNDIDVYYEVHGQGPRLTLIEGLGYHRWMWYNQVPAFSRHFTTLVYDNRGVGRSSKPPGPYSHDQNAEDLAALFNHLGWEQSHVLGVSMGRVHCPNVCAGTSGVGQPSGAGCYRIWRDQDGSGTPRGGKSYDARPNLVC